MRTRSQQASPGGFLSLDDSAPRRTRSTRNTSQPTAQPSASTETTTRQKSQGTTKKTARVAKTQTRKAPQRATRKSTRKTENQTADGSQYESHNNEERAETAPLDDKENLTNESQDPDSVTLADSTVLSEPKSSSLAQSIYGEPYGMGGPLVEEFEPTRELRLSGGPCYSSGGAQEDVAEKSAALLVMSRLRSKNHRRQGETLQKLPSVDGIYVDCSALYLVPSRDYCHLVGLLKARKINPPKKRARNLSYSLFPAPIDRSLYLGDIPKPSTVRPEAAAPESHRTEQAQVQKPERQQTAASSAQAEERETSQASSDAEQRKRKRSPSPDVIPNPAGSSYGLDLDYFCYSSESEDEVAETPSKQSERKKVDGLAKSVARSALRTDRQSSKKVRFDASPEDTPSKLRSRARSTDPYRGTHFVGMGNDSPTPSARTEQPSPRNPGFVPNTQGTFQLDYDVVLDDSETAGLSSSTNVTASSPSQAVREEDGRASAQHEGHDAQSPASRHTSRAHLSTPGKVDEEALARVRSQAEKYKPKTPSGLRTASRYASPLTATPDTVASDHTTKKSDLIAKSGKVDEPENFGDDEFARDAEWLYQNCPSGDLSQLKWPAKQSYEESLGVSSTSMKLLATIWDDSEIEPAYLAFRQSFEEFKKTLK
ncbi:hypothetical protein APSETT444_002522 [Aspergillus pseudonomiae]